MASGLLRQRLSGHLIRFSLSGTVAMTEPRRPVWLDPALVLPPTFQLAAVVGGVSVLLVLPVVAGGGLIPRHV